MKEMVLNYWINFKSIFEAVTSAPSDECTKEEYLPFIPVCHIPAILC